MQAQAVAVVGTVAAAAKERRKARPHDASLWMNLFMLALPVLVVIALIALGVWLVTIGGRSRT
jgi:hypothetical protein